MQPKKLLVSVAIALALSIGAITPAIASHPEDAGASILPDDATELSFHIEKLGTATGEAGNAAETLITPDSPEPDTLPVITEDTNGNIAVVWSHEAGAFDSNIGLGYSTDGGTSWNSNLLEADGYQYYAGIGLMQGSRYEQVSGVYDGLWVSCLERTTESENIWLIRDVTTPEGYEGYALPEGSLPGATYHHAEDHMYYFIPDFSYAGPVEFHIDDDQGMDDGWMLFWWAADLSGYVYNWDAESELNTAPAVDPDLAAIHDDQAAWTENDFFYAVAQHNNQSNGRAEIAFKRDVPTQGADIEYVDQQFFLDKSDIYDAAHPEVVASGSKVAVVYQTTDNNYGDWDIRCKYSSDQGQTWDTTFVANEHQVDEQFPTVYMSGNTIYCSYVKEGNLFFSQSNDAGLTWEEPKQINTEEGTLVEEENSLNIHKGGIVWTDNRNGDKDIYYTPVPAPQLGVESITGGMGVTATIANTGTEDATDVQWTIDLSGPVFVGSHAEGTIDTLAADDSTTISTGLVIGIGPTTISVEADGATGSASGFVLGPLVLGL